MTSKYFSELDEISKKRYLEKLNHNGDFLPDPLDAMVRQFTFSKDIKLWPSISFGDLYMYLVEKECTYTNENFKNFKALECYNYFLSGKVCNVLSYRNVVSNVCVVTCDVQASQTLTVYHKPWIVTSMNGFIYSGHCTCMAGLGEVCSHVAALLFSIETATREGLQAPSATSLSCTWNKSMKKVTPSAAIDINFSHKRTSQKRPSAISQMPSMSAYNTLLDIIKENQPDAPILTLLSDDDDTSTSSETEDLIKHDTDIENNLLPEENPIQDAVTYYLEMFRKLPKTLTDSQKFNTLIESSTFSESYIKNVECMTRMQNKNKNWFLYRKGRITSSLFGRVLKCSTGHKALVDTILQRNQPFSNDAIRYGQINEEKAKKQLLNYLKEQHVNAEVYETGFMIDEQYGFLGSTPDGMAVCDCCDSAVIEIKCPARGKGMKIKDIPKTNFFLDSNLNLKQNHNYYDQIQGQMNIWKKNKCYFVTYTDIETQIQIIEYDNEYWNVQKPNLVSFFRNYVLPEILKNN